MLPEPTGIHLFRSYICYCQVFLKRSILFSSSVPLPAGVKHMMQQVVLPRCETTKNILLIDEHGVFRKGLRSVLETEISHLHVSERSCLESIEQLAGHDLAMIDTDSVGRYSLERFRSDCAADSLTRFAVMSVSNRRDDVFKYLAAGFHGFIFKMQSEHELVAAVNDLLSGRIYVPRWLCDDYENIPLSPYSVEIPGSPRLTRRQHEILFLLADGRSNKEIARKLDIAQGTIKVHIGALFRALGARNRAEAAFKAADMVRPEWRPPALLRRQLDTCGRIGAPGTCVAMIDPVQSDVEQ